MLTRITRIVPLAALACATLALPLRAQTSSPKPAPRSGAVSKSGAQPAMTGDMQTIAAYRLTLPTLRKMAQVQETMFKMLLADPSLKTRYQNTKFDDGEGPPSIDDMAKRFDRLPEMKQAIVNAGLSPREYSVAMLSMFQAAMTMSFMEMDGPMRVKEVPPGVLADNVAFLKANRVELDRMTQRSRELEKLARVSGGESMEEAPDTSSEAPPAH